MNEAAVPGVRGTRRRGRPALSGAAGPPAGVTPRYPESGSTRAPSLPYVRPWSRRCHRSAHGTGQLQQDAQPVLTMVAAAARVATAEIAQDATARGERSSHTG